MEKEKRQRAKVGVAGSLFNQLMSNNASVPVVGAGATRMDYSDRHPFEVVEVSKDGKTVKLQALEATADKTKNNEMGHQNWILTPTENYTTVVWRHNAWRERIESIQFTEDYGKTIGPEFWKSDDYKILYPNNSTHPALIPGKTEIKVEYSKVNILFGKKEYHYDWEF